MCSAVWKEIMWRIIPQCWTRGDAPRFDFSFHPYSPFLFLLCPVWSFTNLSFSQICYQTCSAHELDLGVSRISYLCSDADPSFSVEINHGIPIDYPGSQLRSWFYFLSIVNFIHCHFSALDFLVGFCLRLIPAYILILICFFLIEINHARYSISPHSFVFIIFVRD